MRIEQVASISVAYDVAKDIIRSWNPTEPEYCWFRGCNDRGYGLSPGAYWRQGYNEHPVMLQFSHEGGMFGDVGAMNDWQTYYLAQHHGIPTRLLDWTESFTAALFFAFDGWDGLKVPCIWILRPQLLNEITIRWTGVVTPENNEQLLAWTPKGILRPSCEPAIDDQVCVYNNEFPVAIYPKRLESRLHAQQGMFTVHGRNQASLPEVIMNLGHDPGNVVSRIDLVGFDENKIKQDLRVLGIRRSTIYPDLGNFVADLKDYHEWK